MPSPPLAVAVDLTLEVFFFFLPVFRFVAVSAVIVALLRACPVPCRRGAAAGGGGKLAFFLLQQADQPLGVLHPVGDVGPVRRGAKTILPGEKIALALQRCLPASQSYSSQCLKYTQKTLFYFRGL